MLGRHFIGIEREESYRKVAEKRLSKVRVLDASALETVVSKRSEPRIPFGQLVERGLLRPGEVLVSPRGQAAKVRVDGSLISAEHRGSIHQVGAALEGAPSCNGWTYWQFRRDGQLIPIDLLRQQVRAEMERAI
jgi:modification methylase